ncbi:hypothetical protein QTP86_003857 [Hemibagrus guttatus]|nr:hypothetical protein QTP86_003857 [Hemibagrus guttatus]
MDTGEQRRRWEYCWIAIAVTLLVCFGTQVSGQIKFNIPEEVKEGSVVGNIAKDLSLDVSTLVDRRFRIVSGTSGAFFQVNQNNGVLSVLKKIDREEVCDGVASCILNLKIAVDNPLEIHYVVVEIADVNDHSPWFPEKEQHFEIAETTLTGARFELQSARDPDIGTNSIRTYTLSKNNYFGLEMRDNIEEEKTPVLVLHKALDREQNGKHSLILTAVDGGAPPRSDSGTPSLSSNVTVNVFILDQNDNVPMILYPVSANGSAEGVEEIPRNVNAGHLVTKVRAYDADIGYNGWLLFSMQERWWDQLSSASTVDLKEHGAVQGAIRALRVSTHIRYSVAEEVIEGFVVGNLAKDLGLDVNALVDRRFRIVSGTNDALFRLNQKNGVLYVHAMIDREQICEGNNPCVIDLKVVVENPLEVHYVGVDITDVNDHSPAFPDRQQSILRGDDAKNNIPTLLSINSETGVIHALKSFDYEVAKTFQFHVLATDSGTPPLSSNVTVNVFILDQNDNVPVILYPVSANGSAEGVEEIPRNVNAGHLVTKVRAYDADIGYNGWLLFSLQEVSDHSLFGLDRYTGQIRTLRSFTETDEAEHKLVILVKDNGNISLSATATVIIKLVEPKETFTASDDQSPANDVEENNITFYLIITLGSVSVLFVFSIIMLIVMQCNKATDYSSKYLQDTHYDGTLCHSIQYRSGDKRYMLVGPRTSIGSTLVPSSNGNTLVVRDRTRTSGEIKYSIPEERKEGYVVGNIAKDLELDFHVLATDSGTPPLSSNVTVNVFILDQNDNVPVILYPVSANGSAEGVEEIPRNVNAGHLVTKVRAYDADIGYNGWLLFSLQEVSDHSLFGLDRYTGQIRTLRPFTETDEAEHKLVVLVKDNGNVSLSATATVIIKLVEPKEAFAASDVKHAVKEEAESNVTFYLVITLGSVSFLFIVSIIVLIVMQCSKSTDNSSKYLQETNYDGTLCHSIQYRSGDKRYMLVGPRTSIGSTLVPGSSRNTLVVADRRRKTSFE